MLRARGKAAGKALLSDLRKGKKINLSEDQIHPIQIFFQYGACIPPLPCIFLTLYFSQLVIFDVSFQQNRA